jgi:hypothetical protein
MHTEKGNSWQRILSGLAIIGIGFVCCPLFGSWLAEIG